MGGQFWYWEGTHLMSLRHLSSIHLLKSWSHLIFLTSSKDECSWRWRLGLAMVMVVCQDRGLEDVFRCEASRSRLWWVVRHANSSFSLEILPSPPWGLTKDWEDWIGSLCLVPAAEGEAARESLELTDVSWREGKEVNGLEEIKDRGEKKVKIGTKMLAFMNDLALHLLLDVVTDTEFQQSHVSEGEWLICPGCLVL